MVVLTLVSGLIAAAAVVTVPAAGYADSSAFTGDPAASLSALEQRHRAEVHALDVGHERAVDAIQAANADARRQLEAALASDMAALDKADADAATLRQEQMAAALRAVDTQRQQRETALRARFARDAATAEVFYQGLVASLGLSGKEPTKAAVEAAKKDLKSRLATELAAMKAESDANQADLAQQTDNDLAGLKLQATRLDAEYQARLDALKATYKRDQGALDADLSEALRQFAADFTALKARQGQDRSDLDQVQKAQLRAASTATSAQISDLRAVQHNEKDDLRASQKSEQDAFEAQRDSMKQDSKAASDALLARFRDDALDAKTRYEAEQDGITVRTRSAKADGSDALQRLKDSDAAAQKALKDAYGDVQDSLRAGSTSFAAAWAVRVARMAEDEKSALAEIAGDAAGAAGRVRSTFDDKAHEAERQSDAGRRARALTASLDRGKLERSLKAELFRAQMSYNRQLRLAQSRYYADKIRAIAFLSAPGAFTSVSAAYDPATDPGSLYNVAKRIGATDLPSGATGQGVDVALVDTGVVDVPGLAEANIQVGPDFSFEDAVPELRGRDTMGHGTHLAGIINGRDSAWAAGDRVRRPDRFLGIAPDARVISVKAGASDGSVDVTQIIAAINWVIANKNTDGRNIRVLNLSFGTDGVQDYRIDPLSYAVERAWRAGIVVVVAGGNDGWDTSSLTNPAQDPFVIAVGSSSAVDGHESMPSAYSNGAVNGRTVDLAAPGRSIVSLRDPGSSSDEVNEAGRTGDRFVRGSGTSQAAAVTSGAVALLLSQRPDLTPDQVKYLLKQSADAPHADNELVGSGYLRVDRAVKESAPAVTQTWAPSQGTGTLDGARGTVRVIQDGVVLEGQSDIFGRDWSGAKWSEDSWSGAKWSAGDWSGAKWSGAKWSSDVWSKQSWTGAKWSTDFWTGAKWSGAKWSADDWTGAKWSGAKWSAGGWFGIGWDDGP